MFSFNLNSVVQSLLNNLSKVSSDFFILQLASIQTVPTWYLKLSFFPGTVFIHHFCMKL